MHPRTLTRAGICAAVLLVFIPLSSVRAVEARAVASTFLYTFNSDGMLPEADSMSDTWSPYWWLNSGGKLIIKGGIGMTVQGSLPILDSWRALYASSNSLDTDDGTHPQNLFRLVSRSSWNNVSVESSYKINRDNFSDSPNRNASNGLLLMSRYHDSGDTLYYAGIRVDGHAVIKKKKKGVYTTLAQRKVFAGEYAAEKNVNILPHGVWVGLKSETVTNSDGSVTVRLYMKKSNQTDFAKILEAKDTSNPITGSGYVGVRTDFMDVEFDNFKAIRL